MNQIKHPCAICGCDDVSIISTIPLLPLGAQLIKPEQEFLPEQYYPLHYAVCSQCNTFQSIESVPGHLLRSENTYVSATSKTVIQRDCDVADEVCQFVKLNSQSVVAEIGGSEGVFLENFIRRGIPVVNIEPVSAVAAMATAKGITTYNDFLTDDIADTVAEKQGKADLIAAKHVLEIVPDINGFMKSIGRMLAPHGRIMMEVPYVKDLIEGNFYDILAHLRKYHFSFKSIVSICELHGMTVERVVRYPSLGGGIRFYAGWKQDVVVDKSVTQLLQSELEWGMDTVGYYTNKFKRGIELKRQLLAIIEPLVAQGKVIAGFGAGIKASALLNYCGLDRRYISYLVDNGKHKQGNMLPGVRLPIYSPAHLDAAHVDFVLILAWLHQDEVVASLKPFLDCGGKIIIPTPTVSVIERN